VITSAPGKLMVVGEYAVLDGAEALVTAVSRRAYLRGASEPGPALPPEVVAARAAAERMLGAVDGDVTLDVSELRGERYKLGLGSSAAGAACAAAWVFARHGLDPAAPAERPRVLEAAFEGHHSVAPQGSGADVAASVLGGFVRFRRLGDGIETHALDWPARLETVVVWTGEEARTSGMVAKVAALAAVEPARHRRLMAELASCSEQTISALLDGDLPGALERFDAYGGGMGALGEAAGIPINTETIEEIREIARRTGGAAKASGAGGGDVALALFHNEESARRFRSECQARGMEVLSVDVGAAGERIEE